MKTIIAILSTVIVMMLIFVDFSPSEKTGKCEHDRLEFDHAELTHNPAMAIINGRDYQIELYNDSLQVWDGYRLVSTLPFDEHSAIDSVFIMDNQ